MKRPGYREAIAWIALNDGAGDTPEWSEDPEHVGYLVTACLVADLFGVTNEKVGQDVVRYRQKKKAQ
jgi:hypothetical protein